MTLDEAVREKLLARLVNSGPQRFLDLMQVVSEDCDLAEREATRVIHRLLERGDVWYGPDFRIVAGKGLGSNGTEVRSGVAKEASPQ